MTPADSAPVLLVEDEAPLLGSLQRAVETRGLRADVAANGKDAWPLLVSGKYRVLVTDLRMPEMDGPQLLSRIQERGIPTQVIVITAYATVEAAIDCLRKGAVDFLVKPFEMENFLDSLERALQQSREGESTAQYGALDWNQIRIDLGLTPRQLETLEAFYRTGKSNRELAEQLCVSVHTVKSHLAAAFRKAGVATRAQLLQQLRTYRQPMQ